MDIKYIGGADPEMVFLDNGEEVEVSGSHDQLLDHIIYEHFKIVTKVNHVTSCKIAERNLS